MCEPPRRCRSAAEINQTADALCARARAKELRYDDLVTEAGKQRLRANRCEGRLDATGDIAAMVPRLQGEIADIEAEQSTAWIWQVVAGVTGATAASLVWCSTDTGCPDGVSYALIGALVVEVGALALRLF